MSGVELRELSVDLRQRDISSPTIPMHYLTIGDITAVGFAEAGIEVKFGNIDRRFEVPVIIDPKYMLGFLNAVDEVDRLSQEATVKGAPAKRTEELQATAKNIAERILEREKKELK